MGILQNIQKIYNTLLTLDEVISGTDHQRITEAATQRDYYQGVQKKPLKVKKGVDDNLILNFSGVIVDRSVSMLFGKEPQFDLPGDPELVDDENGQQVEVEPEHQQYIDAVYKANRKQRLLHDLAQFGSQNGTCYLRIIPDGAQARDGSNELLPRLIALDPLYMKIEPKADDKDEVLRYVMRYNIVEGEGARAREVARKEVVEQQWVAVDAERNPLQEGASMDDAAGFLQVGWAIRNYKSDRYTTSGQWELISEELWDYEFPPIVHWQNLPLAGAIYGKPDLSGDVLEIQDKLNFIASNMNKIIRYHAHPKTWGRGTLLGDKVDWGPDEMVMLQGENAMVSNLEMQTELMPTREFINLLRQAMFDISRTVDLASMKDKLGALTNFALRVLFYDALAKLDTKRMLYGEGLIETNHRLLTLADLAEKDGGSIVWGDPLPVDELEQQQALAADMADGLVSKQTASKVRGYDYMQEQEQMEQEGEGQQSLGEFLLSNFDRGL